MKAGKILSLAVLVCVSVLILQSTASAIVLAGNYQGPIQINLLDYDMGTLYAPQSGTVLTSSIPDSQKVAAVGAVGTETTWGIATITSIRSQDGTQLLWSPGPGSYLSVIFYGETDFAVSQIDTTNQFIDGVGLHADLWESTTNTFDATLGASGRTALDAYTGVTVGTKILSLTSKAGFINESGQYGGLTTEFESRFNTGSLTGNGTAYMDVTGGTAAQVFNSNSIATSVVGSSALPADVKLEWTIHPNPNHVGATPSNPTYPGNSGEWLVLTNDPVEAAIVPEPATIIIWSLLGALGLVVGWRRRA